MRRTSFRHRLALVISAALMGLAALFVAAAVLSLFRGDAFMMHTEVMTSPTGGHASHQRNVTSWRGRLWFAYVRADLVEESARHEKRWRFRHQAIPGSEAAWRYDAPAPVTWLGFDWSGKDRSTNDPQEGLYVYRERFLAVPYWLVIAVCGGLGWWMGSERRLIRRRRQRGLCVTCGYDLRGTLGLCPECGAVPKPASAIG